MLYHNNFKLINATLIIINKEEEKLFSLYIRKIHKTEGRKGKKSRKRFICCKIEQLHYVLCFYAFEL